MRLSVAILVSGALLTAASGHAADNGFFVGAGVGNANTTVDDVLGSGYKFDESDVGFKLFGGYKFFPWLGVEGAYIDAGSPGIKGNDGFGNTAKLNIEAKALVAAAVFTLPLGDKFELFIKPGIAYWEAKTIISANGPDFSGRFDQKDNGSAFFIGGGAGFNFNKNTGVRLEYERFDVAPEYDDNTGDFVTKYDATADFFSASFVYSF